MRSEGRDVDQAVSVSGLHPGRLTALLADAAERLADGRPIGRDFLFDNAMVVAEKREVFGHIAVAVRRYLEEEFHVNDE